MQSTHERAERARRLASIRHVHNINRRAETDDQREKRRRLQPRLHSLQTGTQVPVNERTQAPGRATNAFTEMRGAAKLGGIAWTFRRWTG